MPLSIRFLGTAAFEILTAENKRILIARYLDENSKSPYKVRDLDYPDLLLVTHAAYDHRGDTEPLLRRFPDLPLICGADVRGYLMHRGLKGERLRVIPWGMMIQEAGVKVRPIYSRHWSYIQTEDGQAFCSTPLGFIVYAGDDQRIYHSGDRSEFDEFPVHLGSGGAG